MHFHGKYINKTGRRPEDLQDDKFWFRIMENLCEPKQFYPSVRIKRETFRDRWKTHNHTDASCEHLRAGNYTMLPSFSKTHPKKIISNFTSRNSTFKMAVHLWQWKQKHANKEREKNGRRCTLWVNISVYSISRWAGWSVGCTHLHNPRPIYKWERPRLVNRASVWRYNKN